MKERRELPAHEKMVIEIQRGNKALREQFLRDYQGFVAATVSSVLGGRSVDREKDEVFNTGLIALNEALDSFNPAAGVPFLHFARQVISRRVIDWLRRKKRANQTTSLSLLEEKGLHPVESTAAAAERMEIKEDLQVFLQQCKDFGFTMSELVNNSPRHRDSKQKAISIGRTLAEDRELMTHLLTKKTIPLKKLLLKVNVNPKTVERNRIYIIAVALILNSNLDTLKSYIYAVGDGGSLQ